jgi:hypothetical protein
MQWTFAEEIKKTQIGIVATANNNDDIEIWLRAFEKAKNKILRDFKKQERPYFSVIQKSATVTTKTISQDATTRRTRPREHEPLKTEVPSNQMNAKSSPTKIHEASEHSERAE